VKHFLELEQPLALLLGQLLHRDARPACHHLGNVLASNGDAVAAGLLPLLLLAVQLFLDLLLLIAETGGPLVFLGGDGRLLLGARLVQRCSISLTSGGARRI
jgi:hypothetical protein